MHAVLVQQVGSWFIVSNREARLVILSLLSCSQQHAAGQFILIFALDVPLRGVVRFSVSRNGNNGLVVEWMGG